MCTQTCDDLTIDTECISGQLTISGSNSSTTSDVDYYLELEAGGKVFNPTGGLLYTNTSEGVEKIKIRKPKKQA